VPLQIVCARKIARFPVATAVPCSYPFTLERHDSLPGEHPRRTCIYLRMEEPGRFRDPSLIRTRQPDRTGGAALPIAHVERTRPEAVNVIRQGPEQDMKILLAIDDSKFSEAAVQTVIQQARRQDEIRVLHVLEPPSPIAARMTAGYDPAFDAEWWETKKERAQMLVEKTAELLRSKGLNATAAVAEGHTKSKILDTARDGGADLIVLGSHGRTRLEHFLMGGVSEGVARHAGCSVEIVRISSKH
jgi:universal stress protein A